MVRLSSPPNNREPVERSIYNRVNLVNYFMQEQELEKLKNLIQTSGILSEGERGEWLQLVDLMNDKQKLELERILKSSASEKQASPAPTLPLKHIVNLPGSGKILNEQPEPSHVMAEQSKKASPAQEFASHLQTELAEKELPSGEAAKVPSPTKQIHATAAPKPKPAPQSVPAKNTSHIPEPVRLNLNDIYSGNLKIYNKEPTHDKTPQSKPAPAAQPKPKPAAATAMPTTVQSGLQRPDMLVKAELYEQQHAEVKKQRAKAAVEELHKQSSLKEGVETLHDIEELSLPKWRQGNHESLMKKIKGLISAKGYFDVIFSLQKSPLYAAYVLTGTEILKNQKSFEDIEQNRDLEKNSMVQNEFEGFTDLLRNLQVS